MMLYLGILAAGVVAIISVLANENKKSKPSPVDLLNSLEVDEAPDEDKKIPPKKSSSSFLNRLNLNDDKTKKAEEQAKTTIVSAENNLDQSAAAFEEKIKQLNLQNENPIVRENTIDESTKNNNSSSQQTKDNT